MMGLDRTSLSGLGILLTRPEGSGKGLIASIEDLGGRVISLPTIEIQAVPRTDALLSLLQRASSFDAVIFVSKNAVDHAHQIRKTLSQEIISKTIITVGPATAAVLRQRGVQNVLYVDGNNGSEALLALSELQTDTISHKKILIVRGVGGRELLARELSERGAKVEYAQVYQRCRPDYNPGHIHAIWQKQKPDVIVSTSAESLQNLIDLTAIVDRPLVFDTMLIVISERLKQVARQIGFNAPISVSAAYSDEEIVATLHQLCVRENE